MLRLQRLLLYIFQISSKGTPLQVPLSEPHRDRRSVCRAFSKSPVTDSLLQVSPAGPLWRETPVTRVFFYISFKVPSKGAPLQVPLRQTLPFPEPSFTSLSKSPVKESLLQFPPMGSQWRETPVTRAFTYISFTVPSKGPSLLVPRRGPHGERCPFPRPSFTYLSEP
jgi:hypothetical protein